MRKFTLLFAVLLSLVGVTANADPKTLPYSYGFENYDLDSEGWTKYFGTSLSKNNNECAIVGDAKKTGSYGFRFSSYQTSGANAQYLISPELPTDNGGITVSFAYMSSNANYAEVFKVGYSTSDTDVANFTWEDEISYKGAWTTFEETFPAGTKYVAIYYYSNYQYRLFVDDFEFTAVENLEGPAFKVFDGEKPLSSPYAYSFGLATAGTTKVFTLSNPGTEATPIAVNTTGANGFTAVVEDNATSIPAGGEVTLTITMPDATASGSIVVTPTGEGLDPFTFNVSGTVRDANKLYESGFTALPEDWTTTGTWYYSAANGAYTTVWYLSSNARLVTPKLTIAEGEKFYVEAKGYSTSNTSYQHLQMQYSADGSTWTNFDDEPSLDPSNWQTFEFTGVPAGNYYIAINASQADIRMFYGGSLPQEPKMVVTQPASLDFGTIEEATAKTFTIANTGLATLEGISVTSSNNSIFSITGAPTSLAAGASAEVTITMAATTTGALNSNITVSATDMEDVEFTVTGVVLPEGMMVVDFNDNQLPAGWGNNASNKWSFAEGKAYCTSTAELTTPKVQFAAGDMLAIKITSYDNYDNNYIEITGSTDGSNWTAFDAKKYISRSQIPYGSYATIIVSDIPTTVKYLKFKGYYVRIDEIAGLTYAPVLSVTKEEAAVSSPANYDFGECASDAAVTYSFANTGAGTISITDVAITGEGAEVYSTNWKGAEELPFNLDIIRSYDAERVGASDAVITVTTTEGNFVINVTGTDKSANDPELSVTPNEDAAFGVVTEATEKTYTVTNAGTGTLTVNITSNDAKFTVSTAQLADIAAGDSRTFKVIFTPVAETYGVFNANITVTPTYDAEAAVVIAASAKVKDPEVWSEDFSAGTLPTGWNAGANWTFTNGVAKAAYAYGSTTYLTTPNLTVADASDELTFDYETTANYVTIKIQYSKDGADFVNYSGYPSSLSNGATGTFTITGLEAGDYQFRFANDDYQLDNFEGFKLNLPDHMASITASSIPESSSWDITMKENRSFEATVTVKELRGVDEELTAKLYMGEELIGTQTGSVEANCTQILTITCTPTEAAPSGAEMHIEVEWAGETMTTANVTRYVAALTYLTLDETSSDAIVAGTYDHVTFDRQFPAGWNTVCLPFDIVENIEEFFGEGAIAYAMSSHNGNEIFFSEVTGLEASYPYIVYVPVAITEPIALTDITIANKDTEAFYRSHEYAGDKIYFRGTYAPISAGAWTKNVDTDIIYGLTLDGKIRRAGASATMKGFRGYFDLPKDADVKALVFEDTTDGVKTLRVDDKENQDIYDLSGRKMNAAQKGIYVVGGRKVIIK